MELTGKVAIVTGASTGIGRAYVLALANEGATVIAAARSMGQIKDGSPAPDTLAEVAQAGRDCPGAVHAFRCDIEDESEVVALVNFAVVNFGSIDILVNNAGIYPHYDTFEIDGALWDTSMNVNARGAFFAMREAGRHMRRQRSGAIVNLTSNSANMTPKGHAGHEDLLLYGVSKAALDRLTTFMAEELKEFGVAVNGLSPGAVETDTWVRIDPGAVSEWKGKGMVKPCTPEAVGPAMLHLAKQTAAGMTGQIVHTDQFGKSWP